MRPTDVPWHRADAVVGYGLEPNQQGLWKKAETSSRYGINGQGFNNRHNYTTTRTKGRLRIAILGDSFVEAFQVPPGKRFFDLLEARLARVGLDAEIYTFAVSGYGTGQEMLLLEKQVLTYKPDLVILVFVHNDLTDSACILAGQTVSPCFYLDRDGKLALREARPYRPNRLARFVLQSAMVRYVLIQRSLLDRVRASVFSTGTPFSAIYNDPPSPEWMDAWNIVGICLDRMSRASQLAGAPFLVVNQSESWLSTGERRESGVDRVDLGLPGKKLASLASQSGFAFYDLDAAFGEAGRAGKGPFLIPRDGHWNLAGHDVVAEALVDPVRRVLATRSLRD